ncbi:unnamed protein product [Lactuca virosa]|uniref:Replication factor A C-terminal domain-containing protein n=1 Tax=Lactuca virosa TaxID=75947 RepID=A0AAU9MPA0_9ASTR|nr:unnamed protein product [Lactuca virosa]
MSTGLKLDGESVDYISEGGQNFWGRHSLFVYNRIPKAWFSPLPHTFMELGYASPGTELHVRILRFWTPEYRTYETWFLAVDKYGDAIQILGQRKDQRYVQFVFTVSKCYAISKYGCGESDSYQNWLDKPILIAVGMGSSIREILDTITIPKYWFYFISKNQIPDYVNLCPGIFLKFVNYTKKDGQPFTLLILSNDSGEEIAISLWKECTDIPGRFNRSAIENACSPAVLAVTNVKVTPIAGTLRLGTTCVSHVYINPPIGDITALIERHRTNQTSKTIFGPTISLHDMNQKTHSKLLEKTFIVNTSVMGFTFTDTWYQVICPDCKTPTFKQGKNWFCPSDGILKSPSSIFKLVATIVYQTDSMNVILSDNVAQKLLGARSDELITEDNPDHRKTLPLLSEKIKRLPIKMVVRMTKTSTRQHSLHDN